MGADLQAVVKEACEKGGLTIKTTKTGWQADMTAVGRILSMHLTGSYPGQVWTYERDGRGAPRSYRIDPAIEALLVLRTTQHAAWLAEVVVDRLVRHWDT